ncbi:alpha/beta hydrolase [Roseovarius sp. LXJ103]|uniref:alpha/beta fold hydrolase n=1 Tax=Roseovarius carneus TaxID=2853164 RepID=UPI000D6213F1|nr:alpha/beta hydrolase [Roseovarius carneus]MBZ8118112.1 alpha/beta hydrolase [Roseovarius carneus]PWE36149.1 alpha/beta hydrolase [Pelagicola sp. LXJ1103]
MPRGLKGGFPTYWTSFGQGPQQALLIHCSLAQSNVWGGLAQHLSGALTMTAFDLPGHGRSGDWDGVAEMQALSARMAADCAGAGPVDVIGHSFGATVALRMAHLFPGCVRRMVLIEPVFFAVALGEDARLRALHAAEVAPFEDAMEAGAYEAAAQAFLRLWGDGTPWARIPEVQRARLAAQMPLIAAAGPALYGDVGGLLAPGVLEALPGPSLLIEGSRSPEIIGAINMVLAARLAGAERSVIGGAGHMSPITHPQAVSTEILRFLRG